VAFIEKWENHQTSCILVDSGNAMTNTVTFRMIVTTLRKKLMHILVREKWKMQNQLAMEDLIWSDDINCFIAGVNSYIVHRTCIL